MKSNSQYLKKYLKYKMKYLNLLNHFGGTYTEKDLENVKNGYIADKDTDELMEDPIMGDNIPVERAVLVNGNIYDATVLHESIIKSNINNLYDFDYTYFRIDNAKSYNLDPLNRLPILNKKLVEIKSKSTYIETDQEKQIINQIESIQNVKKELEERERLEQERLEQERLERERLEQERLEREYREQLEQLEQLTIRQLKQKIEDYYTEIRFIKDTEEHYIKKWNNISENKNREEHNYYYKLYEQKLNILDDKIKKIEEEIKVVEKVLYKKGSEEEEEEDDNYKSELWTEYSEDESETLTEYPKLSKKEQEKRSKIWAEFFSELNFQEGQHNKER
jgi:hypothetical protein